jgi:DNA processing protein
LDFHLLALHRLLYDKPSKLLSLINKFGSAEEVFRKLPSSEGVRIDSTLKKRVQADVSWLSEDDHHLVCYYDPDYPSSLKEIHDPPVLMFADGDRQCLSEIAHWVAMVGSRSATHYGLNKAQSVAADLAVKRVGIVSGMALGIDGAAHEGALEGQGVTIAVLGSGCDVIYPKRHWRLAERIRQNGLLMSEYPLGCEVRPWHFPMRNRIVVGMSDITVVVEAAMSSGSLISARLAANEGREVMALPGLVTNSQAKGCHQLIKDGATMLESSEDILRELGLDVESGFNGFLVHQNLTASQQALLDCLAKGALSMDMLSEEVDYPVEELTIALVSLEVLDLVYSENGRYQLK